MPEKNHPSPQFPQNLCLSVVKNINPIHKTRMPEKNLPSQFAIPNSPFATRAPMPERNHLSQNPTKLITDYYLLLTAFPPVVPLSLLSPQKSPFRRLNLKFFSTLYHNTTDNTFTRKFYKTYQEIRCPSNHNTDNDHGETHILPTNAASNHAFFSRMWA